MRWRLFAAWMPVWAISGCGPSVQSIHEGSVRFEHCYRLDLDPRIATPHRHACWKQWIEVYSYGQSRDRLEYARRRIDDIAAGDPDPPQLSLATEDDSESRQFYMSMPAPTSAHAPPPPIATSLYDSANVEAPGDRCVVQCRTTRTSCLARCKKRPRSDGSGKADEASSTTKPSAPNGEPKSDTSSATSEGEDAADQPSAPDQPSATASPADAPCECEATYRRCAASCFQ